MPRRHLDNGWLGQYVSGAKRKVEQTNQRLKKATTGSSRGRYSLVDPSYLPEMIVTPNRNSYLTDELGNPAISMGALRDIGGNPTIKINRQLRNNQPIYGITNKQANNIADFNNWDTSKFINAMTLGGMNNLSPTQWIRRLYDIPNLAKGNMTINDYINRWTFGNEGVVSSKFVKNHPYVSLGTNLAVDVITGGLLANKDAIALSLRDKYGFVPRENTFTRGIGGEEGLIDLVGSGKVRGNPRGTEVSANSFGKLFRRNRNDFASIMKDTKLPGIQNRFFNRSLTKEDFDSIKREAVKYSKVDDKPTNRIRFALYGNPDRDPLSDYASYADYLDDLRHFRPTTVNRDGQPLAYFYNDGRNPLTSGHDYASSKYGVRINNVAQYEPFIHKAHLHYSLGKTPSLYDPNVEVFVNTKLGTFKIPKWYFKYNKSLVKKYKPYIGEPK